MSASLLTVLVMVTASVAAATSIVETIRLSDAECADIENTLRVTAPDEVTCTVRLELTDVRTPTSTSGTQQKEVTATWCLGEDGAGHIGGPKGASCWLAFARVHGSFTYDVAGQTVRANWVDCTAGDGPGYAVTREWCGSVRAGKGQAFLSMGMNYRIESPVATNYPRWMRLFCTFAGEARLEGGGG